MAAAGGEQAGGYEACGVSPAVLQHFAVAVPISDTLMVTSTVTWWHTGSQGGGTGVPATLRRDGGWGCPGVNVGVPAGCGGGSDTSEPPCVGDHVA